MWWFIHRPLLIRTAQLVTSALVTSCLSNVSAATIQAAFGVRFGRVAWWWWRAPSRLPFRHSVDLLT